MLLSLYTKFMKHNYAISKLLKHNLLTIMENHLKQLLITKLFLYIN